jgi:tetratricopeptide (TPR) repeat protein
MEEKGHTSSLKYASMLCMMGDVRRDTSWYTKAWEVSEQKCARAMRSLARAHFFKNELELAVECYEKAFKINQLYPRELFTCGCAYMKLQKYEKAIYTFGISISIDERDAEAWGNIANCYMALNKISEALQCTENALKINRRSWRLWHNLIRFALTKGELYRAMFAVNMLIELNQKDGINGALLVKISELFLNKYADDSKLSEEAFLRHKKRLFDFFKNYSNNINDYGVHRLVWKVKGMLGEPAED